MNHDDRVALHGQVSRSSFYAGMRVLPQAEREAMFAVYAFCRAVDDIADDIDRDAADRTRALGAWRDDIAALFAGGAPGRAELVADAARDFHLAEADFIAVIDGMAMDTAGDIRAPDAAMLDLYCDRVASAVGRLSVRIFGMTDPAATDLAHHLGRALQLTNILRDIDEDAAIGRLYLPREHLQAHGIDATDPLLVAADPRREQRRGRRAPPLCGGEGDPCQATAGPFVRPAPDGGRLFADAGDDGDGGVGAPANPRQAGSGRAAVDGSEGRAGVLISP